MGFSAGGDGAYQLSERLPHLLAACSPQGGHPNGVSTINICNLPIYFAAGEKDSSFKRNQICIDYYKKVMGQNGKYLGKYIAKVEVVAGSGHSFQCWKRPRKSFFNGSKSATTSNETAFDFMYSYTRNPFPTEISLDTKCFLTPLRNYYTQRGNTFYNIEVGKNPSPIIQVKIDYAGNTITVKEGTNFKINLMSSLFGNGGDIINVISGGKTVQYRLQKDQNYARNNMKLFCDPYYGFDSYITIGNFQPEVNVGYQPQPPTPATQQAQIPQQINQRVVYPQQSQIPQQQRVVYPQQQINQFPQQQMQYGYQQGYQQAGYQQGYQQAGYQQGYQRGFGFPGRQGQMGYPQQPPQMQFGNVYGQQRFQYGQNPFSNYY